MISPIYKAERRHQKHVLVSNRSGTLWIWVAVLMLVPALLTAVIVVVLMLLGIDVHEIPPETDLHRAAQAVIQSAVILLIAMNVAQTLVVTMVASGLAAESVRREHRHQTWDLLVLTGQSARAIARGKMLAAFWTFRRDLMFVVVLRMGLLGMVYGLLRQINQAVGIDPLHQGHLVVLLSITVLWTVLDAFMGVATAVAAAASERFRSVALFGVFGLRVIALWLGVIWLTTVCSSMAAAPTQLEFVVWGGLGLLAFALAAYLSVLVAEFAIRRAGASIISQPISQAPIVPPSTPKNIPNLSQA